MYENNAYTSDYDAPAEPLTDWNKEPDIKALIADLDVAKPSHDVQVEKVQAWRAKRDGKNPALNKDGTRSSAQPRLIRKQQEWRYAPLTEPFLGADRLFEFSPRTFEDVHGAEQNSLVLEWQFNNKIDKVSFFDELVRATVDDGTSYIRVGWYRETRKKKVNVPVYQYVSADQHQAAAIAQAIESVQQNPRAKHDLPEDIQESIDYTLETGKPAVAIPVGMQEQIVEEVIDNRPTLDIIDVENIYIDPSCEGNFDKANFVVVSFSTSKAELKKDGRYTNLDKVVWASSTPLHEPEYATTSDNTVEFKDDLRKRVVAYEYWGQYDIDGNGVLVPIVATWVGNTIIRMERNPFPDQKPPLVAIPYMPVRKKVSGEPDAELLGENQDIIGALTRGMIDLMGRSANGQTGIAKGALDVVNRRRFEKGADYEFNPNMQPQAAFHTHKFPEIPASAFNMLSMQNAEAESLTGVKAFSGGLSGEAYGDVAAGIRGVLDASSKREMSILRRLISGVVKVGKKIAAMNAVFLSEEETIRVTNDEFVTVRREDLKGNFDMKVDIVTPEIEESKAQDLSFLLQTLGNTVDFGVTRSILVKIAKLKSLPDLAKQLEEYAPAPDPVAQKMQELQLLKLEVEIQETQSKIALNRAKAENELAEAEQKDLDFVEQETGTKHARAMEQQTAQAMGNQALEITKADLAIRTAQATENKG